MKMVFVVGNGLVEYCELCKERIKYGKYVRIKLVIEIVFEEI